MTNLHNAHKDLASYISGRSSKRVPVVIGLDLDQTVVPTNNVNDKDVTVSPQIRAQIAGLLTHENVYIAIITGRCSEDVENMIGSEIYFHPRIIPALSYGREFPYREQELDVLMRDIRDSVEMISPDVSLAFREYVRNHLLSSWKELGFESLEVARETFFGNNTDQLVFAVDKPMKGSIYFRPDRTVEISDSDREAHNALILSMVSVFEKLKAQDPESFPGFHIDYFLSHDGLAEMEVLFKSTEKHIPFSNILDKIAAAHSVDVVELGRVFFGNDIRNAYGVNDPKVDGGNDLRAIAFCANTGGYGFIVSENAQGVEHGSMFSEPFMASEAEMLLTQVDSPDHIVYLTGDVQGPRNGRDIGGGMETLLGVLRRTNSELVVTTDRSPEFGRNLGIKRQK